MRRHILTIVLFALCSRLSAQWLVNDVTLQSIVEAFSVSQTTYNAKSSILDDVKVATQTKLAALKELDLEQNLENFLEQMKNDYEVFAELSEFSDFVLEMKGEIEEYQDFLTSQVGSVKRIMHYVNRDWSSSDTYLPLINSGLHKAQNDYRQMGNGYNLSSYDGMANYIDSPMDAEKAVSADFYDFTVNRTTIAGVDSSQKPYTAYLAEEKRFAESMDTVATLQKAIEENETRKLNDLSTESRKLAEAIKSGDANIVTLLQALLANVQTIGNTQSNILLYEIQRRKLDDTRTRIEVERKLADIESIAVKQHDTAESVADRSSADNISAVMDYWRENHPLEQFKERCVPASFK